MKYDLIRLDGRYAYRHNFKFYLRFTGSMARQSGPVYFNDAMTWFAERYGWSAEIKQWHHIDRWTGNQLAGIPVASGILAEPSAHCNPHWSWSNLHTDLRIYVATEQELAFFQLTYPVDQKKQ
jgi:hypothetical protein